MPGITDPTEEYFKDGLWAWDPADPAQWRKLIIDPLTNRLVIDHPGDIEVVQPVPADLLVGPHGWDGDSWQKLPMVWGYSGQYDENEFANDVTADNHDLTFSTVPDGEVWVIETFCAWANQVDPALISLLAGVALDEQPVRVEAYPAASLTINAPTRIILKYGDRLVARFTSCALNNDIRAHANGYKMKIAE